MSDQIPMEFTDSTADLPAEIEKVMRGLRTAAKAAGVEFRYSRMHDSMGNDHVIELEGSYESGKIIGHSSRTFRGVVEMARKTCVLWAQ